MSKTLLITYVKNPSASEQFHGLSEFVASVAASNSKAEMDYCAIDRLVFELRNGNCRVLWKGQDIAEEYDVLLLRNFHRFTDYANALRLYATANGMTIINQADVTFPYLGKVSQGFLFAYNGVPTPDFVSTLNNGLLIDYLLTSGSVAYPMIVKHNEAVKGLFNFLVKDEAELRAALQGQKPGFLAQPFIENDGELRVLTFPGQAPLVFSKRSSGETHLNNTARGGHAELLDVKDVDKTIIETAQKIQKITGRELGGIDVLLAKDGEWVILEVNHTPALSSGMFIDKKAAALAETLAGQKGKKR